MSVYLTQEERRAAEAAARSEGMSMSAFIRRRLLQLRRPKDANNYEE